MSTFDEYIKPCGPWKTIAGWNDQGSFEALKQFSLVQNQHEARGHVAEIGVHHGQFFVALALLCQEDEKALAIDVFDWQGLNIDRSGMGDLGILRTNIEQYCPYKTVVIKQADSLTIDPNDILELFEGQHFRLIHIDGGHTTRHTTNDLKIAEGLIEPGGLGVIMVDDLFHPKWPGVTDAVFKYLNGPWPNLVPFAYDNKKLYLTDEKSRHHYLDHFRTLCEAKELQVVELAGFETVFMRLA